VEWLLAGLPFQVGDKVHCTSGGVVYDGIGHIAEISVDPKDLASPVVPMFRVEMDEKAYPEMPDEMWYPELLLKKVEADA
jgi:hypothetical protein